LHWIVQQNKAPAGFGQNGFQSAYRREGGGFIACLAGRDFKVEVFLQISGVEGEYDNARFG